MLALVFQMQRLRYLADRLTSMGRRHVSLRGHGSQRLLPRHYAVGLADMIRHSVHAFIVGALSVVGSHVCQLLLWSIAEVGGAA